MDDHSVRKITLRSDENSLKTLDEEYLSAYTKKKREDGIIRIKRLILFFAFLVLAVYLYTIDPGFATLIAITVTLFAIFSVIEIYIRITEYLTLKKQQSISREWIAKHKDTPFVHYKLYDDRLEYEGEENIIFSWSEFTAIHDQGDQLIFSTAKTEVAVLIPKSVLINPDDFEYFSDFAKGKIEQQEKKMDKAI